MAEMASAWHNKRQCTQQHPADPPAQAPAAAAGDVPWVQRSAAHVWRQTQQQQRHQQLTPAVIGCGWDGDLWGSGDDAGADWQGEAGGAGQHKWSGDDGWDADQENRQQQQQQEWDGGVWGQQDDGADADPSQQQQQQDDTEAETEEDDDADDDEQQDEDDEPVQLESADFDLSRYRL